MPSLVAMATQEIVVNLACAIKMVMSKISLVGADNLSPFTIKVVLKLVMHLTADFHNHDKREGRGLFFTGAVESQSPPIVSKSLQYPNISISNSP